MMRPYRLLPASLCAAFLAGCATSTDLPSSSPQDVSRYLPERSYAANVGARFGIRRFSDDMTAAEQRKAAAAETHWMRNIGTTILANSPLQGKTLAEASKGPFSTSLGLDFMNLGWKPDTTAFEAFDHWFALVADSDAANASEAVEQSLILTAEAFADTARRAGFEAAVLREERETSQQDETLERAAVALANDSLGCPKPSSPEKSTCRILLRAALTDRAASTEPDWLVRGAQGTAFYDVHRTIVLWHLSDEAEALLRSDEAMAAVSRRMPAPSWLYAAPRKTESEDREARLYESGAIHRFASR